MPQIGPAEILVVVLVALLVFGPHRLPEVGRQVGRGMRELKKLQATVKAELDAVLESDDAEASRAEGGPLAEETDELSIVIPHPESSEPVATPTASVR